MNGSEVKQLIRNAGLKLWEVAGKLGMNDGNFSRRLRKPFSQQEVDEIKFIISELSKEKQEVQA